MFYIRLVAVLTIIILSFQLEVAQMDVTYENEEIKEFHFHVYFFQQNQESKNSALKLREDILRLTASGFFQAVPYERVNTEPRGPHTVGSYEVWCPKEYFSRVYSWFLLHRGQHSILVHPLTKKEVKDHTERAVWMGPPVPLDITKLTPLLSNVPLQYPELGLGYSARSN